MDEREKELEELVVALLKDLDDRSGYGVENLYDRDEILDEWIKTWMGIISSRGYTKKHFPVEKLEDIETKIIALGNRLDFMQDSVRRNQEMLNQAMTIHSQLLYIVRGLEKY